MHYWNLNYLHTKAIRDCLCLAHNIAIPQDPQYGQLTHSPKLNNLTINNKFWQLLQQSGHSSLLLDHCKCNTDSQDPTDYLSK